MTLATPVGRARKQNARTAGRIDGNDASRRSNAIRRTSTRTISYIDAYDFILAIDSISLIPPKSRGDRRFRMRPTTNLSRASRRKIPEGNDHRNGGREHRLLFRDRPARRTNGAPCFPDRVFQRRLATVNISDIPRHSAMPVSNRREKRRRRDDTATTELHVKNRDSRARQSRRDRSSHTSRRSRQTRSRKQHSLYPHFFTVKSRGSDVKQ